MTIEQIAQDLYDAVQGATTTPSDAYQNFCNITKITIVKDPVKLEELVKSFHRTRSDLTKHATLIKDQINVSNSIDVDTSIAFKVNTLLGLMSSPYVRSLERLSSEKDIKDIWNDMGI